MPPLPFHRSLQGKLLAVSIAATCFALLLTAVGVLVNERRHLDEDARLELETLGRVIAMNSQAPLAFDDPDAALEVLDSLAGLADDVRGWILRPDGTLLAGTDALPPAPCASLRQGGARVVDDRLVWAEPVALDGESLGCVVLSASRTRFVAYWRSLMRTLLGVLSVSLVLSALLGRRLLRSVSRPLWALNRGAGRIMESGDYGTRVPRTSDDELGDLTDRFNAMVGAVEKRDRALQQANDTLERNVAERTADLMLEIEERALAQEAMRVAKEEAELADQAKSAFLANMSHELRTPLHGILSYAQFGLREAPPEPDDLRHYFQSIHEGGQVLLHLLNDLLDLAKLESGKMTFDFAEVRVRDLLDATLAEFESQAAMNHAEVVLDESVGELELRLDPARFQQLLRNLVSNALKFSPEGGTVELRARHEGSAVRIEVLDRGAGIPEDELEAIFDKFIQSSKTRSGAGGTGLGLAICREIAAAFGGTVRAGNRQGGGAVLTVELPVHAEAPLPV